VRTLFHTTTTTANRAHITFKEGDVKKHRASANVCSMSMSETRVVSAATDSCSAACSSGAHVQPAQQCDAIGGREHDDDRRSPRARHAQIDRAGRRRRRRAGRAAAPAAPKHVPLVGEQHHAVRRDVGRRAHRLLGHLEYGSGRSSRPRRQYLCGRRELRVGLERGVGTWLGEGRCWRHTVRCAHVNEKHVPRERRQLRVGMGAVYWNEGAGSRE